MTLNCFRNLSKQLAIGCYLGMKSGGFKASEAEVKYHVTANFLRFLQKLSPSSTLKLLLHIQRKSF